jgi:FKBP-type peptidyl-prolyl cis-trans isomerase FkpA
MEASYTATSILCVALSLGAFSASAQPAVSAAEEPKPRHFVRVPAPNGVHIRRYNKTDGKMPTQRSRVIIHYHGTLEDGSVFDSSVKRGSPENMSLEKVIPCWQEGLTRLRVGEKAQLRCPPATAYGLKGQPPKIPPNETLTFEVEILAIQ